MLPLSRVYPIVFIAIALTIALPAYSDERHFTYSRETDLLPEGGIELEQWITHQNGRDDGDYAAWNFRTELEYGVTDTFTTAAYLNWDSVRTDEESDAKFKGISLESIYQILNPNLDPVGLAIYGEATSDGIDWELEGKILLSKEFGRWVTAINGIYEAEWEREDRHTEREATLQFTAGLGYKVSPQWSVGIETRNKSAYPGGLDLSEQEYQTWSVGPNVHYGASQFWATLTLLPQVWGNGDGSSGSRQLVHEEELELRLMVGYTF